MLSVVSLEVTGPIHLLKKKKKSQRNIHASIPIVCFLVILSSKKEMFPHVPGI